MSLSNFMDMKKCTLCPRSCEADRLSGTAGYCQETAELRAVRAALYAWEEPCISGKNGSGAVFFEGCNLGCLYCQNYSITSLSDGGKVISAQHLAEIFLSLQDDQHADNINLVTPSHYLPQIIGALKSAKRQGLTIPVVYNTGTYERVEAIKALEGLVDVWLPDLKYMSPRLSYVFSNAPDYFEYASRALSEMVRQCPEPVFADGSSSLDAEDDADDPLMLRGVLVRHLALPGCIQDSMDILKYLYETYGNSIFISIMRQYTPMPAGQIWERLQKLKEDYHFFAGNAKPAYPSEIDGLSRKLTAEEYDRLVDYAVSIGIENGFVQEEESVSNCYIPIFDGTGL